ncbi:hypothetical protein GCM10009633_23900 [Janibacter melonis]
MRAPVLLLVRKADLKPSQWSCALELAFPVVVLHVYVGSADGVGELLEAEGAGVLVPVDDVGCADVGGEAFP